MCKICKNCKKNKDLSLFYSSKTNKDGKYGKCIDCFLFIQTDKRKANKPIKIIEKVSLTSEEKLIKRKLKKSEAEERFKQKHGLTRTALYYRRYKEKNGISYETTRRKNCKKRKLATCLRGRLNKALESKRWHKNTNFSNYIGCSKEELVIYLESKFQDGMTWDNHTKDGWHIDHIIPLSSATTDKELYKLCHYTNLQPLWATDNLKKRSKLK